MRGIVTRLIWRGANLANETPRKGIDAMNHQATHNQLGDVRQMMNKGLFQLRMIAGAIAAWICSIVTDRLATPSLVT